MSFETGAGDADSLFEDDEPQDNEVEDGPIDDQESTIEVDDSTDRVISDSMETNTAHDENSPEIDDISNLDIRTQLTPEEIAYAMMTPEYRRDSQRVPYAVWRDSVSYGRKRMTFEVREDVDELVGQVQAVIKDEHGSKPSKTDLREFALIYGLLHYQELVKMADEWGLQYDN